MVDPTVMAVRVVCQDIKREADWFRIGFEPLFVDLSKLGCFYLVFLMVKVWMIDRQSMYVIGWNQTVLFVAPLDAFGVLQVDTTVAPNRFYSSGGHIL